MTKKPFSSCSARSCGVRLSASLLTVTLLLSACGKKPELPLAEKESLYQTQHQAFFQNIQSFFPVSTVQALQTDTSLEATSQNSFKGNLTYFSTKQSQGSDEKATHTFDLSLQNLSGTPPLALSGIIDTLYTDQLMHFNVQKFNLFMGAGNAEANFINLLAKDLANKRVTLDKNEKIWLSIIETPDLSSLLSDLAQLYKDDEIKANPSPVDLPDTGVIPIINLSEQHLISAQRVYDFLTQLLDIPLRVSWLTLDPILESTLNYTSPTKDIATLTKEVHYRTNTHTFTVQLTFSPKQVSFVLKDIVNLSDPENIITSSYEFLLEPKNNNTFILTAKTYQNNTEQRRLKTELQLKKADLATQINLQGELQIMSYKLDSNEPLHLRFQGLQTMQPTASPDLSLTGTVISLSDII